MVLEYKVVGFIKFGKFRREWVPRRSDARFSESPPKSLSVIVLFAIRVTALARGSMDGNRAVLFEIAGNCATFFWRTTLGDLICQFSNHLSAPLLGYRLSAVEVGKPRLPKERVFQSRLNARYPISFRKCASANRMAETPRYAC